MKHISSVFYLLLIKRLNENKKVRYPKRFTVLSKCECVLSIEKVYREKVMVNQMWNYNDKSLLERVDAKTYLSIFTT